MSASDMHAAIELPRWRRQDTIEQSEERLRRARVSRNIRVKRWRYLHADTVKANDKQWKLNNPEAVKRINRRFKLKKTYGITDSEFDTLLASQKGKCAICRTKYPKQYGTFHVDHNHKTKAIRGLLCQPCNIALGLMKDDEKRLRKAAAYLRKHEKLVLESIT